MYARNVRLHVLLATSGNLRAAKAVTTLVRSSSCTAKLVERNVLSTPRSTYKKWNALDVKWVVHSVMIETIRSA